MSRQPVMTGVLVILSCGCALQAAELRDAIVNGAMPGWEEKGGKKGTWSIQDGVLTCTGKPGGWFGTVAEYTDFVLELEVQFGEGGNSGIFLRVPPGGDPVGDAMEVQILDDNAEIHRNIKPWQRCGSLYHIHPALKAAAKPLGDWNHYRITAEGSRITVTLNGQLVVNGDGESHPDILKDSPRGQIGFQNHHTPVHFRNIRIADLSAERMQRSEWFREAKFGIFVHWGLYAVIGRGEWVMLTEKIPAAEYEKLAPQFNPTAFNADEWAALAKRAGARYMVLTSKHHDGFAMYDSKVSGYDVIDSTPWKKDPSKELADACAKQGIRFGFYHSILDWHHPDYAPVPEWDKAARAGHTPDYDKYLATMRAQVRELCTGYGPLACLWWDGGWDHKTPEDKQKFAEINALARELQPQILINNRANTPEDFSTPEQFIPPTGMTHPDGSPSLWENCITLTTGHGSHAPTAWWGYDRNEKEFKTPEFCIRMLVDVVSKGGNLLLNVGPEPTGRIRPEEVRVLEAMGKWLQVNGDAIYGTTASPFNHLPFFGKATSKGDKLFLHVFSWPADARLVVPGLKSEVRAARLLAGGSPVAFRREGADLVVQLPPSTPDPISSVVVLELDGPPQVEPATIRPSDDGVITLPVLFAELRGEHGQRARYESAGGQVHIGNWTNTKDHVAWQFESPGGEYEVSLVCAAGESAGGTIEVQAGDATIKAVIASTGGLDRYESRSIGRLKLGSGPTTLIVRPTAMPKAGVLMNLRAVALTPAGQ